MKKYKKISKEIEIPNKIICNSCGKTVSLDEDAPLDFLEVNISWGYYSKKDGETDKWDICEECYDNLIESFSIPPDKNTLEGNP